jgi:hypothetical protein
MEFKLAETPLKNIELNSLEFRQTFGFQGSPVLNHCVFFYFYSILINGDQKTIALALALNSFKINIPKS